MRRPVEPSVLYAAIGLSHRLCRRPFFLISTDPDAAYGEGWPVRIWDLLFCASFGVVVTSSVRIAGVVLVFAYLIFLLAARIDARLVVGRVFGAGVSTIAMVASAVLDLPTGATVVCAFGLNLVGLGITLRSQRTRKSEQDLVL